MNAAWGNPGKPDAAGMLLAAPRRAASVKLTDVDIADQKARCEPSRRRETTAAAQQPDPTRLFQPQPVLVIAVYAGKWTATGRS